MRLLLFLLLSSVSLIAQDRPASSDKYVWAKSGLVLRAEGNPKGKKLATIPYGATVQLTGERGESSSIEVIPKRERDGETLAGWEMPGQFVGVRYGGLKGFAFNGYISNYDPIVFTVDSLTGRRPTFEALKSDTLHFFPGPPGSGYGEINTQYENGITFSDYHDENGGGNVMIIPNATLVTGYLLAVEWFFLHHYNPEMDWENAYLVSSTKDSLIFERDGKTVTIREYFGVVIITYNVHC